MVTVRVCSKLEASKKRLSRDKGNRLNQCKSQRIEKVTTQEASKQGKASFIENSCEYLSSRIYYLNSHTNPLYSTASTLILSLGGL